MHLRYANTMEPSATSSAHTGKPSALLLEILVCPVTKTRLRYDEAACELVSEEAGLAYPVRDGIPIMLPEEARKL
jgi:uncharacterized protein YbaR (Trm112 family)